MTVAKDRLDSLNLKQRALLEGKLLRHRPIPVPALLSSPGPKRLSFAQESLWFLDQLLPGSPLYNIPQAFRLRGPLNVPALHSALQQLVDRHAALRTKFESSHGQPAQLADQRARIDLSLADISALPEPARAARAEELLQSEIRAPFRLDSDLPIRVALFQLAPDDHLLAISVHHIVADHWSLGLLHRELSEFYNARLRGEPPFPAPLPFHFPDLAHHERATLDSSLPAADLAYWKKQLGAGLPSLDLPTDRPRPKTQAYRGSRVAGAIDAATTDALRQLGREQNASLYMILAAAFQALLFRYSGQEKFAIGAPVDRRQHPGSEDIIAFLVNTLPLRADLSGDPSFSELVSRVREAALGLFAHQKIPLEKLLEELKLPRGPGHQPAFQVVFQFLSGPLPSPTLDGVTVETVPVDSGTAKFDLTFTLAESGAGLTGDLEYNSDLFDRATATRLLTHFSTLLQSIVQNPASPVSALKLLTPAEENVLLRDWNDTRTKYPRQAALHELFADQARSTPDAPALIFGDVSWTYRKLDQRANQLARHLQQHGVAPGHRVGVSLDRSPDLIASLLAILKTGAAYVPLDAAYPPERLAAMSRDAGLLTVLTTSTAAHLWAGLKIISLDLDAAAIEARDASELPSTGTGSDLAYVMFTSGSTGQPKGVAVPHRAVIRLVRETDYARFSSHDVFLQFAPISFDASTFEIWGALLNGAKLVLYPPHFESLQQLGDVLARHQVTTLWLTAGLFHQVIEENPDILQPVKQLLAGGDALSVPHVARARELLPHCDLINGYGPTENTTFTCCYSVPSDWTPGRSVPIGRPISNTQVYIFDTRLQPVPVGVPGELYAGGDGLALGYLNRPELTAEKFIDHPFVRGEKLYRTGDLARYLPDGQVEFLGRLDNQVKIRGFRVEPGEVEIALSHCPGIQSVIVLAPVDASGNRTLTAYAVAQPGAAPAPCDVHNFAAQKLPDYLIPSQIFILQKFPLTENGKVDRRSLAALRPTPAPAASARAPKNSVEEKLATIWGDVLKIPAVGVDQNFFELGGHSLMATRLISRVNSTLACDLSLATLFEFPTIESLAPEITRSQTLATAAAPIRSQMRRETAEELLQRIDQLSEAEVESLLNNIGSQNLV